VDIDSDDCDNQRVNYFADRFQKKFMNDLRQSLRALRTLRTACEHANQTLSTTTATSIICDSFYGGHDFMDNISVAMLIAVNDKLLQSIMTSVAQVFRDSNMSKSNVTDVIMIGGPIHSMHSRVSLRHFQSEIPIPWC
jgi:L1 cell adhesion molecule like protein